MFDRTLQGTITWNELGIIFRALAIPELSKFRLESARSELRPDTHANLTYRQLTGTLFQNKGVRACLNLSTTSRSAQENINAFLRAVHLLVSGRLTISDIEKARRNFDYVAACTFADQTTSSSQSEESAAGVVPTEETAQLATDERAWSPPASSNSDDTDPSAPAKTETPGAPPSAPQSDLSEKFPRSSEAVLKAIVRSGRASCISQLDLLLKFLANEAVDRRYVALDEFLEILAGCELLVQKREQFANRLTGSTVAVPRYRTSTASGSHAASQKVYPLVRIVEDTTMKEAILRESEKEYRRLPSERKKEMALELQQRSATAMGVGLGSIGSNSSNSNSSPSAALLSEASPSSGETEATPATTAAAAVTTTTAFGPVGAVVSPMLTAPGHRYRPYLQDRLEMFSEIKKLSRDVQMQVTLNRAGRSINSLFNSLRRSRSRSAQSSRRSRQESFRTANAEFWRGAPSDSEKRTSTTAGAAAPASASAAMETSASPQSSSRPPRSNSASTLSRRTSSYWSQRMASLDDDDDLDAEDGGLQHISKFEEFVRPHSLVQGESTSSIMLRAVFGEDDGGVRAEKSPDPRRRLLKLKKSLDTPSTVQDWKGSLLDIPLAVMGRPKAHIDYETNEVRTRFPVAETAEELRGLENSVTRTRHNAPQCVPPINLRKLQEVLNLYESHVSESARMAGDLLEAAGVTHVPRRSSAAGGEASSFREQAMMALSPNRRQTTSTAPGSAAVSTRPPTSPLSPKPAHASPRHTSGLGAATPRHNPQPPSARAPSFSSSSFGRFPASPGKRPVVEPVGAVSCPTSPRLLAVSDRSRTRLGQIRSSLDAASLSLSPPSAASPRTASSEMLLRRIRSIPVDTPRGVMSPEIKKSILSTAEWLR